ncbi:MAG: 3-hydroxyacyl-CoA dehydrogenase [Chloroflexi bacterium]|nr:3-hydroxyacyl-CoA dehydrogenase [Chloroflexota bacterium]
MAVIYKKDKQNIVTLTLDLPGSSVNVINLEFGEGFTKAFARLQTETDLAGVVITSAKKTFMAGGDLEWLHAVEDPQVVFESAELLKDGFRVLETFGKPVVAAINGTALGGGLELALACHYRIASDNPKIKIGFPEVTLGLLPGGGGVTRLTRMLGLQEALPYLMEGKQINPDKAKALGIIDELAESKDDMLDKAKAWILSEPDAKQPWDKPGYRIPGGDPRHPKTAQMLAIAPAMLAKRTYGNYPAPEAIMSAAVEGAMLDFDTASRIESRYMAQLVTSQVAKNMINTFWFQLNEVNSGANRPDGIEAVDTKKVGVLGAGLMGHGIAYVSAYAGLEVILKDVSLEKANAGKAAIEKIIAKRVSRGRMTTEQQKDILQRIKTTESAADLASCDLIIEAVFEDRDLKANVTAEAEAQIDEHAVFGSNTSTLPISGLAENSARPENFIGIHFFSPVHKMRLVEIIVGEKTSDQTLAKAFDYVLQINKTPIVVNDSRGFYTSRVFSTYVNEGMALLGEGQHPRAIESAGLKAGMAVGPLVVSDEVSLELMTHIRDQTRKDMQAEGKEMPSHPANKVLDVMVLELGRKGKANGAGFYDYPEDGKKHIWPGLQKQFSLNGTEKLSQEEMIERMMFVQALETVRCHEEGVLSSVADANIGSIFGWGFAPFQGGTLQYINAYGVFAFVERSRELAQKYGERFMPPDSLVKMAEKGQTF